MTGSSHSRERGEGETHSGRLSAAACLVIFLLCLTACQNPVEPESDTIPDPLPVPPDSQEITAPDPEEAARRERHRRRIADWLYEGLRAMREDRLMTPPDNSAHAWFSRVLALEPDNELALEGLDDIAARYVELAGLSARQGRFDSAEQFLRRAALVDPDHPQLEAGRDRLALERRRTHSVHRLDAGAVARRDAESLRGDLGRVEELLAGNIDSLYVLITAPDDEQGRWIYGLVRERVGVQRLPGDIEIGAQPSIRLVNRG